MCCTNLCLLLDQSLCTQALLAVRPEMPRADVWRQRVQEIHETWAEQLSTRDRDITPGGDSPASSLAKVV